MIDGLNRRITPAYAGISLSEKLADLGLWDHPRMRGDKIRKEAIFMRVTGSPPHARG